MGGGEVGDAHDEIAGDCVETGGYHGEADGLDFIYPES